MKVFSCNGPAPGQRCPSGELVDVEARNRCCAECQRVREQRRGTAAQRGYGAAHRAERAAQLPDAYGKPCRYCGERMWPHQNLVLDHTEDRTGYRGIVHADYRDCPAGGNAAEGASRGNQLR